MSIRPCKQACSYVWKECKDTTMDNGEKEAFCANAGENDAEDCYNAAGRLPAPMDD
eukprot:gene4801-18884_t